MFQGSQRNPTTRKLRTTNPCIKSQPFELKLQRIRPEGPLVNSHAREGVGSTRIKTERRRCGSNHAQIFW